MDWWIENNYTFNKYQLIVKSKHIHTICIEQFTILVQVYTIQYKMQLHRESAHLKFFMAFPSLVQTSYLANISTSPRQINRHHIKYLTQEWFYEVYK